METKYEAIFCIVNAGFSEAVMDKPDAWLAFEVLFWTGLREGEMLALTPSDIDLARSRVSVTNSIKLMAIGSQSGWLCPSAPWV